MTIQVKKVIKMLDELNQVDKQINARSQAYMLSSEEEQNLNDLKALLTKRHTIISEISDIVFIKQFGREIEKYAPTN